MTDEWQQATERRLAEIEKAIAVDKVIGSNISTRLDKIEGTLTWLVRLIIGAIVTSFILFALNGGIAV